MSTTPFQPTQIPNCVMWFDAADSSTVETFSGNNVFTWKNKGLQGGTATIPIGTITTGNTFNTTSLNVIQFDSSSYLTIPNITVNQSSRSLFYIFTVTSYGDGYNSVIRSQSGVSSNQFGFNSWNRDGNNILFFRGDNTSGFGAGNQFPYSGDLPYDGTPFFAGIINSPDLQYISVNGYGFGLFPSGAGPLYSDFNTNPDNFLVGQEYANTLLIGEIIEYSGEFTRAQANQVEGYLAWKWGLESRLPINHPYYDSPPTGPFIDDTSQLNLINTIGSPGILQLPSSYTIPGRVLMIKDQTGAFSTNTLTITTNNANQTIDSVTTSTINNTALGWQNFIAGNNDKWYTIGGTLINTVNTSTMNAFNMSTVNISTANIFVSTMGFRDQTLNATYTLSVQSSLMYYNYGGISTVLAGTRQSFGDTFLRMGGVFSPNQISGLQLWLDAADVNRFTGGQVWLDESDTNNNAINAFPGITRMPSIVTMNGQNAASFRIANSNSVKSTNFIPAFSVTYFLVLRSTGGVAGQNFIFINDTNGQRQMEVRFTGTNTYPAELRYTTNSPDGYPIIANINQNEVILVCLTVSSGGSNLSSAYFNGSISPNQTQTLYDTTTPDSLVFIGAANDGSRFLSGDIGEILIYNQDFTEISGAPIQRQQVEGYLAWKWGLVGNLPTNHPFKNRPP